jgi:hypothetical protein
MLFSRTKRLGLLLAATTGLASADVMVADLDTSGTPIPEPGPYAVATFTLNPDETIGVNVAAGPGLLITWFGFNKPAGATVSGISPAAVFSGSQITSGFADANDGFCLAGTYCFTDFLTDNFYLESAPFGTSDLSFTLSQAGGFTDLSQLINATEPFPGCCIPPYAPDNIFGVVLTDDPSNAQKYSAWGTVVPEPSSLPVLFSAIAMAAIGTKRKLWSTQ